MAFSSWRATMGLIKPTHRPGSLEETIRLLPEGIGVVPLTVGFSQGDRQEFDSALDAIEARVDELARIGVDLIAPAGAPPFMVHGYRGSARSSTSGSRPMGCRSSQRAAHRSTPCALCQHGGSSA